MAQPTYRATGSNSQNGLQAEPRTFANGYLFQIPLRDLGWFSSLLMGLATGMVTFFAGTFLGIVFILFYNSNGHATLNYAWSYTRIGLPAGILMAVISLSYLGWMWSKRQLRRA